MEGAIDRAMKKYKSEADEKTEVIFKTLHEENQKTVKTLHEENQKTVKFLDEKTDKIFERLNEGFGEQPTPKSVTQLGSEWLEECSTNKCISRFIPLDGQPSVLTEMERNKISVLNERESVKFLTPVFQKLLDHTNNDLVVVNSEDYPWLKTSGTRANDLKPDLFICHRAIYERKGGSGSSDNRRFGILSDWKLRDCIGAIVEAKIDIDNKAFGEVVTYMMHIHANKGPNFGRAVLFGRSEFWLIDFLAGCPAKIVKVQWTDAGSAQAFATFPKDPKWIKLLRTACEDMCLVAEECSFLGSGAFGRVFKVHRVSEPNRPLALKLVAGGSDADSLFHEFLSMTAAVAKCPKHVMGVERHSYILDGDVSQGGALLLSQVGKKISISNKHSIQDSWITEYKSIIESLRILHESKITHGDARLANIVKVDGTVKWIDFRGSAVVPDSLLREEDSLPTKDDLLKPNQSNLRRMRNDMANLIKSILRTAELSDELQAAIALYDGTSACAEVVINLSTSELQNSIGKGKIVT